jgi:putative PIG3 family NAD(P)H quinone oxidoreductase
MAVPSEMTAVEISAPGGPEVLKVCTRPVPSPGPGEVLIGVEAAGVNRPDVAQRKGVYPPPPGASDLPGLEVAGEIVALGAGGEAGVGGLRWSQGDRTTALLAGGGYAAYAVAPAVQCLPIPDRFSAVEAAALPETFFTVWTNVFQRGRLKPGELFLVHGGSSGIGTTAIQLAKAFGARVFATAGSDEKCRGCEALGADRAINHQTEDFVQVVREAAGGADLILDMVGGPYVARNLSALKVEGRLVQIAFMQGAKPTLDLSPIMTKRLTLTGSTLRPRTPEQKGAIAVELLANVWPLLARRTIRPIVHRTYPLAEAAAAHALMESGAHIGKIVLIVR